MSVKYIMLLWVAVMLLILLWGIPRIVRRLVIDAVKQPPSHCTEPRK